MTKLPVVVTHGFMSTAKMMLPLKWMLERGELHVHLTELSPFCIQDVRMLARQLRTTVERVRARTGQDKVDLVGISQGGVIGLYYIHKLGGHERVRHFVTVGSPVQGTWASVAGIPFIGGVSKGIWQLIPGSTLCRELTAPLPTGLRVTTLAIAGDPVCPPARCVIEGADNRVVRCGAGPMKHQMVIMSPKVLRTIRALLKESDESS
ncbi:MAG: alpha/beta fold hydrolase [Myxococcota bacterium]|nr:alpha/beta fold hydrolase [Myxococcota bacterium]